MSNAALQAVTQKPAKSKPTDLAHLLMSPQTLAQIKAALPRHMTAERMARVAITEIRKTPDLAKCDVRTFMGAVMQLSQLGLEPGGSLGHAYLIPFKNTKTSTVDVQLIIGYRGMIDLARRSGQVSTIQAVIVREGDEFNVRLGDSPKMDHVPAWDDDKPMTHAYCVVVFKDGSRQFDVMSRSQIEKIRKQSRAGTSGPWVTHFEEMARKTVIRRLFKYLPVSIELQRAVMLDERGDAGLAQVIDDDAIDSTATEIETEQQQIGDKTGEQKNAAPAMTLARLLDLFREANNADTLDADATLIEQLPADQRAEATAEYKRLRAELA